MWPHRDIESLCTTITSGGTPKRSDPSNYDPGTIPWIKTAELQDAEIVSSEERISQFGLAHSSAKILPPSTVLMAMYGATVGKLGITQFEMTCNQASCAMITDPARTSARWLFYSLLRNRADLVGLANGAAQQNLSARTIRHFQIPVPPLSEQKAIAEVLGALDDKIAANRKLITTIDELMVSLVENLTPDAVLSQLASLRRTPIQPAVMPPTVSHYSLPRFDEAALPGHEANESIKSSKFSFDHPAVLLSKLNPRFPRIWNVATPETNAVASTEFLVLEPKSISTAALWALLSTARASEYLQEHVAGTTGSHQRFKPGDAMAMPMPSRISPELEQTLSGLGDRAVAARYESRTLASLRDTLLPALMDGTIRVKDAETHVEEVL